MGWQMSWGAVMWCLEVEKNLARATLYGGEAKQRVSMGGFPPQLQQLLVTSKALLAVIQHITWHLALLKYE